jgi:hypothetical protein
MAAVPFVFAPADPLHRRSDLGGELASENCLGVHRPGHLADPTRGLQVGKSTAVRVSMDSLASAGGLGSAYVRLGPPLASFIDFHCATASSIAAETLHRTLPY